MGGGGGVFAPEAGRPRAPHSPLPVTASLHLGHPHVPGCRADHRPVFTRTCIHLARLVCSHFIAAGRSLCEFSEVRQKLGSEAGNGLGETHLKTRDFHPHTVFDGMQAAEEEGQGRRPLVNAEQLGTKAGMRGSRALTHTHAHERTLLTYDTHCTERCPVLGHTFRSSREPNRNTNLTSCSLQVDASRFTTVT